MNSKRVRNRARQATPTVWAAFACADVASEAMYRRLGVDSERTANQPPGGSGRRLFVLLGQQILEKLRLMLAADERYGSRCAELRRRRRRRDRIVKRLYHELGSARLCLKGLLGLKGSRAYLGLQGPTGREPFELYLQAEEVVRCMKIRELRQPRLSAGGRLAEKWTAVLEASCQELDAALDAVAEGQCQTAAAMLVQREAMAAFDRAHKEGARAMEAQLIGVGLPTLGDAVRPGVGRRGRPRKAQPVDLYPDLVEKVRAEGLIELNAAPVPRATVDPAATVARTASPDDVLVGVAGLGTGSAEVLAGTAGLAASLNDHSGGESGQAGGSGAEYSASAGLEKVEQPVPEWVAGDEKSQHGFPERAGGDEKSQYAFLELAAGDEKSQHGFLERAAGDEKSEQPLRESGAGHQSSGFAGSTSEYALAPPISDRCRRRRVADPARRRSRYGAPRRVRDRSSSDRPLSPSRGAPEPGCGSG